MNSERISKKDHKLLAIWAADCAEHVLPLFENKYPKDYRPREAISTLKEWIETGEFNMKKIRGASLSSHAAAREVIKDVSSCYIARACGQAVATAHVATHSVGAALYALKAIYFSEILDSVMAVERERKWQLKHVPSELQNYVFSLIKQKQKLLPSQIRN